MLYAGFLLSIFLDYVRPGSYLPIINAIKLNSIVPLMVLVAAVFYKGPTSNARVFQNANIKLILFFLFLLGVSVLIADVTFYSYNIFTRVLGFVFWTYIISRLIISKEKMKGLFIIFVVSHITVLALNPQVVLNPAVRSYIWGNPFLGDGNDFALSVCIVIPMCIYLFQKANKILVKGIYVVVLIALLFAVIGTQSRGATIALACAFLYLWWAGRQKVLGLLLIGSVVAVVINYAPPAYFERMNSITNYENEGSAQGRIIAWKTAMRMVKTYPLTGVGSGHFPVKLGTEFRPPEYGNLNLPWLTAHSLYFLVIGELGVPGIVCLLLLLIGSYFRNARLAAESQRSPHKDVQDYRSIFVTLNASLISFAVGGAFLSVAYYPHLYVLIGFFAAAQFMYENNKHGDGLVTEVSKPAWYENDPVTAVWDDKQPETEKPAQDKW